MILLNCKKSLAMSAYLPHQNTRRGDKALIYLGRYLYRGVIQEKDILKCENGMVTFRYRDSKTKRI